MNILKLSPFSISTLIILGLASIALSQDPRPLAPESTDSPVPKAAAAPRVGVTASSALDPNTRIIDQLQNLLSEQARFGQTPANNRLLADVDGLIRRHSVVAAPKVDLTNMGPGIVQITKPNGQVINLYPRYVITLDAETSRTNLEAIRDFANIKLRHVANGPCRFWDGDDRLHTNLSSSGGPGRDYSFVLGRGLRHYHLEK